MMKGNTSMTAVQDWRDSKAPKWAKEAAEAEIGQWRLTAALAWPTEARPKPVPFRWGDYDRLTGKPVPGVYWTSRAERFELKKQNRKTGETWKQWVFKDEFCDWSTSVRRGPLFDNERDAVLWLLWDECEAAGKRLMKIKKRLQ